MQDVHTLFRFFEQGLTASKIGDHFFDATESGELQWSDVCKFEASVYGQATGWLYFACIGWPDATHVKIGFTTGNPNKRIASLQTGCPFHIYLVQCVPGNFDMERELHEVLAKDRCCGEWFALTPHVKQTIASIWNEALS